MIKIIVISDSHNNRALIKKLLPRMLEADYVFTLGDMLNDYYLLKRELGDKLFSVKGNCDSIDLPSDKLLQIGNLRFFLTHGHFYGVKQGYERIYFKAKELNADVVLFGHSHYSEIIESEGVKYINPGCLCNYSEDKSYCYIIVYGKKANAVIVKAE